MADLMTRMRDDDARRDIQAREDAAKARDDSAQREARMLSQGSLDRCYYPEFHGSLLSLT